MKYYIIAGEASGDMHGANLMKEIKSLDPDARFRYWGGDKMQNQGGEPVKHIKDLAFMGFIEVVMNLRTILGNLSFCKKDIAHFSPDVIVLIDYPGFNIRIAEWAKKNGFKAIYYISPQVWAWKAGRVHKIVKSTSAVLTILPFEKAFYQKYGYQVNYVGHPLLDEFDFFNEKQQKTRKSKKEIIALLPGSRKQEIKKMLPVMLQVSESFPKYKFIIAGAPSVPPDFYHAIIKNKDVEIIQGKTYELLSIAHAALVTSGTATLETGIFKVPQVVCYKGSQVSYWIGKQLVDIKYISLVNLILDKPLITELIQDDFNIERVKNELNEILMPNRREEIRKGYQELEKLLLMEESPSSMAAKIVFSIAGNTNGSGIHHSRL